MYRKVALACVSLALILVAEAGLPARAAAAAKTFTESWSSMAVSLERVDGSGQPVLLVSGELSPDVKPPVDVALPVPPGAKVIWSGEIMGNDPSGDIKRPFQTTPEKGFDYITFTMSKSPRGQVEVLQPKAVKAADGTRTAVLDWVASAPLRSALFRFGLPLGSTLVTASPGVSREESSGGLDYYGIVRADVTRGERTTLFVTFKTAEKPPKVDRAASSSALASGGSSARLLIGVASVGLIVGLALLALTGLRTRSRSDEH